jgi:hypothetical protein
MIGSASGFTWEFRDSGGAGPAASGLDGGWDGTWADAMDWSAGSSTAIKASLRNPLDTQQPSFHLQRRKPEPESAMVVATLTIAV